MFFKIFTLYIIFVLTQGLLSQQGGTNKNGTIIFNKLPLRQALEILKTETGADFVYNDKLVEHIIVNGAVEREHTKAVDKLLRRHGISYKLFGEKTYVLYKEKKNKLKPLPLKPVVIQKNFVEADSRYVVHKAVLISKEQIVYPPEAVINNIEGKVTVKFLIDFNGDVQRVLLISSSGSDILDSATVHYARDLKYIPAQANGKSVNIWMLMSFEYLCIKK